MPMENGVLPSVVPDWWGGGIVPWGEGNPVFHIYYALAKKPPAVVDSITGLQLYKTLDEKLRSALCQMPWKDWNESIKALWDSGQLKTLYMWMMEAKVPIPEYWDRLVPQKYVQWRRSFGCPVEFPTSMPPGYEATEKISGSLVLPSSQEKSVLTSGQIAFSAAVGMLLVAGASYLVFRPKKKKRGKSKRR